MKIDNQNYDKFPRIVREQFDALGTEIDIQIVVDNETDVVVVEKNIKEIRILYTDFTHTFSRFDLESELSKLNRSIGEFNFVSDHMREVVLRSLEYSKKTNGLYDPRIIGVLENIGYADDFKKGTRKLGDNINEQTIFFDRDLSVDLKIKNDSVFFGVRMDFSGIVKGYITDKISEFLILQKWENFLVNSGGDAFLNGVDEDGKKWTVGVEGIEEKKLILVLDGKGVATSGIGRRRWEVGGRRFHHIINPKKPEHFSFDLRAVSVVADTTTDADVLAKIIFLMGREDGILYARENDIAVIILNYRGTAWISPKAKEYLHKNT